jgi:hypothetical protein
MVNLASTHYTMNDEGEAPGLFLFDLFASLGKTNDRVSL